MLSKPRVRSKVMAFDRAIRYDGRNRVIDAFGGASEWFVRR